MKKVLLSLLLISNLAWADEMINGKISGTITDSGTKEGVEFATVALVTSDGKTVDGTVCDDKGKFSLNKVAEGKYQVVISFVGYETKTVDVEITERNNNIDLGKIAIVYESKILNDVVVEGQRALIEERVDRTIYNAENDATTQGGDATDVLKRVPMLSVDLDGNVSLRGSQNILVLINNKPSTVMANSIADALKQIPADQIKSVEVITSPSAKYDAEGTGGIINIITKKNTLQGVTMNVNSSFGIRGSNLGLNGNYRQGKLGISVGGHGRAMYNVKGSFENEQVTKDPTNTNPDILNIQRADTRNQNLFGNYRFGFDYDFDKYNSLTGSLRIGARNGNVYQDNLLTQVYSNNPSSSLRNVKTVDESGNYDINLTYTRLFEKPQREFSILGLYSRNNRINNFENIFIEKNGNPSSEGIKSLNDSYNQEMTLQLDYQTPIGSNQMIEFGGKDIFREAFSNFSYFEDPDGDGVFVPDNNSQRTNNLNYDQNVSAGYLSYTYSTKASYSFKAGARYEYTTINARTVTEEKIDIPSYGVLVPSLNISKKLKNNNTLKASYNRRIQRPSIQYLNPNIQGANPYNYSVGNPELSPEYTNNFELGYSTFVKGTSLNFTSFVRNTNNSIQRIRDVVYDEVNGDKIRTTYLNIGQEDAYGMSVFANIMKGKLTVNGGGDIYYATLTNNSPIEDYRASNEGWVVSGRFFGSYQLKKDWAVQFFTFYRGNQVQLQGSQGGFGIYSLALNKNFNEKRGSIGFGAENFFTSTMKIKSSLNSLNIDQKSVNVLHNMNFKINFNYRIGKMSFDQRPRRSRKSINNDDLKEGGGGVMGAMNEGMQPTTTTGSTMQRPASTTSAGNAQPAALPQAATDTVYQATGAWVYTVEGQQGGGGKINITKEGDNYSGTIKSDRSPQEVKLSKVTVDGNNIYFAYTMNFGGNEVTIDCKAVITDKEMNGIMNIGTFRSFPIKATRE